MKKEKSQRRKIIIVGGHFTPALSFAEEAKKNYEIIWIGVKKTSLFAKTNSLEFQTVIEKNYKFYSLIAGKFSRFWRGKEFFKSLIYLARIPIGILQAIFIILKEKPLFVVGFGGYTSVAVSVASKILGKKFFIHEQILTPSLASRITFPFVQKLFLSFPTEIMTGLKPKHANKSIYVGNFIRREILEKVNSPIEKNLIFVIGGNQGSEFLNNLILQNLHWMLKDYKIIHQTGGNFDTTKIPKEVLKDKNYNPKKFFGNEEMAENLAKAEIIISRSGANIVYEMLFLKKKGILIPLPNSANKDEQMKNAKFLQNFGMVEILTEKEILKNKEIFRKVFKDLISSKRTMDEEKRNKIDFANTAKKMIEEIEKDMN
ncbi:MAG: undecaprenyldiphospho-muramoylpentapeptide beta-N-acetylglucosaminyltransferase [Patescibacteria group bacterium]